jgi:hypothetical protein
VKEGQITIVSPEWIRINVGNHYWLLTISRRAARADAGTNPCPINRFCVFFGQAGRRAMPQSGSIGIQKKNGAQQPEMLLLDVGAENFQNVRERGLRPDHCQDGLIEQRRSFQ